MATVNKDFKVKNGLVVEGTTGKINGYDILTKKTDDQNYIIGLLGGSATSTNTPDSVVLRDVDGSFAGEVITAEGHFVGDITGDVTGTVSDISNHDTDDLSEGTTNKYYTDGRVKDVLTNSTQTNISITEISGVLHISAENGVADSTTDDLDEGITNLYYTDGRVDSHLSGGDGISYSSGTISADVASGLEITGGQIVVDRDTVDTWYDAAGTAVTEAGYVASDLTDHINDNSAHGVTGDVVGTTDTQTLTNKTIGDTLNFVDGFGNIMDPNKITIDGTNLAVYASNDLTLRSGNNNIILDAADKAYYGSASAENEIATHGYVDNAVAGLTWKQSVNLLWDDPAANGAGATGTLVIDGHAALTQAQDGYRILTTANGAYAGIYTYTDNGTNFALVRSADADSFEELVGAAVYVMEGTQYGSTSWVQGNHYLTGFTGQSWTQFSGTGSVTAGTGITVDGLEVSIDRTTVDTWYDAAGDASSAVSTHAGLTSTHGVSGNIVGTSDTQTLSNKTFSDAITLTGTGNFTITGDNDIVLTPGAGHDVKWGSDVLATESYVDNQNTDDVSEGSTNLYYTDQRVKDVLTGSTQSNISITEVSGVLTITAENGVADSTTDDLDEGTTNHYFTDQRAEDAAGNQLANATKSNIDITYVGGVLSITAENGVADSTTDDLDEGTTNLYFTNTRARDAVDGTTRSFTAINLNTYRTEEATQQVVAAASTVTAHTFTGNKSVKYVVRTVGTVSGTLHSQITEILATVDENNNVAVTEYGTIHTSEDPLSSAIVDYSTGEFRLRVTTAVSGCEVIAAATIMSWAD